MKYIIYILIFSSFSSYGAEGYPNNFMSGDVITADQLNENFNHKGKTKVKRLTTCNYSGSGSGIDTVTLSTVSDGNVTFCFLKWSGSLCDNGAPSGSCIGMASKFTHAFGDQDWEVIEPNESLGSADTSTGGMRWFNSSGCNNGGNIRATYLCEE